MARVKRGTMTRKSHKKILDQAKGFRGRASTCFRIAVRKTQKAMQYAYIGRKIKKRDFRALWIVRINAALREMGYKYSTFMGAMAKSGIEVDRKMLANLAATDPKAFASIVENVIKNSGANNICLETNKPSVNFVA